MGFCSQCGRPVEGRLTFCPACGAARTPATAASYASQATPGTGGPRGNVGEVKSPLVVLLLVLVTLGIYSLIFWFRAARETDEYMGRPDHARGKVRLGLLLILGAFVGLFVGLIGLTGAVDATESEAEADAGMVVGLIVILLAASGLAVAGSVIFYIGQWRIWTAIQEDEQRRQVPKPISPGLMLVFVLVPYVNFVTMWIVYHRTQSGLNGMWESAHAPTPLAPRIL